MSSSLPATQTDNWSKSTIDFLVPFLRSAKHHIRIATGFFTVQAFDLLRSHVDVEHLHVLVGYDEAAQEQLRSRLIEAILNELRRWGSMNRRAAVLDLADRLRRGEIEFIEQSPADSMEARLRRKDHAKVFIFDDTSAVIGSANLTVSGLRSNSEAVTSVEDPHRVQYWLDTYRQYWTALDTENISQALLDVLLRWLKLADPFDVYLRTLLALATGIEFTPPRAKYKRPVEYQRVVIERVLRQLRSYRGSMLVASTGLGKTVMAKDVALRLNLEGLVTNVIVFAPLHVQPDWEDELDAAGVHYKLFTRDLLDQPVRSKSRKAALNRMMAALERVHSQYLIIVDESQRFRHRTRATDGEPRHSVARLRDTVEKNSARMLLLTATPFSRGVDDINNQLYLLPHTAPPEYVTTQGQHVIPGVVDDLVSVRAWKVQDREDFFEEFIDLPVTTVISTSQVARDCGYDGPPYRWDEERRFLLRCELDAAYFHLYGIERDDVDYILETFPIVKRKDIAKHGEYRTQRVILEIYDEMAAAMRSGVPYSTRLDPPPADPRVAHPAR